MVICVTFIGRSTLQEYIALFFQPLSMPPWSFEMNSVRVIACE